MRKEKVEAAKHQCGKVQGRRPVFPVEENKGEDVMNNEDLVCSPCNPEDQIDAIDEEEQAVVPQSLPSVYQQTRS